MASADLIYTIAGTGTAGNDGDNSAATSATLNQPSGIAIDSTGDILYFANVVSNVVRKITISTGIITTIAGTGGTDCSSTSTPTCFSGDDGQATSAQLNAPFGVAFYDNNVYIAEKLNNRIRKVVLSTGIISTVAGSSTSTAFSGDGSVATSATLNYPQGISVDSSGNLYISDSSNNRIRKVSTTGIITTIAGTGTTTPGVKCNLNDGSAATNGIINKPFASVVDSSGNVYISDSSNNRIRKITSSTSVITSYAGSCVSSGTTVTSFGFSGDGGSPSSAQLNIPAGVAFDSAQNLYFVDNGNYRIRKVTAATGIITTIAGTGIASSTGDGGQATSASLYNPFGIVVAPNNFVYFTETGGNKVRVIEQATNTPSLAPSYQPSSLTPTFAPSLIPTTAPTSAKPTPMPTSIPTTTTPSSIPTVTPTTATPSSKPTSIPTAIPTLTPTRSPSLEPTVKPSFTPTATSSLIPTATPSFIPTAAPSFLPR